MLHHGPRGRGVTRSAIASRLTAPTSRLSCPHGPSPSGVLSMNRRDFLSTSAASGLALSGLYAAEPATKPLRVGLIGSGWYGKCSPLPPAPGRPRRGRRPVRRRQEDARRGGPVLGDRTGGEDQAPDLRDYRDMLKDEALRHRPGRDPRSLARAGHDRRRRGRGRRLGPEADQRRRGRRAGDGRRRPQAQEGRPGRHPAAQHPAPGRGPRPGHQGGQARQDRPRRDLLLLPHAG